jgi:ABC-type protease/lipase transport system fused ATPase/permease subunit
MKNSKILASESNAEALRLHALMKQRNEDAVRAVEEMSKHPYSWEQVQKQEQERQQRASDTDGTTTSKP